MSFKETVVTIRYLGTSFLLISLLSFVTLVVGITKNWTKLFFPYFGFTAAMIIIALFGSVYSLFRPDQRSLALVELIFALMEAKLLFTVASYYKQLRTQQVDYESSFDIGRGVVV